jgi:hypothetical protein
MKASGKAMHSERLWVLVLGLTLFGAGFAAGMLVTLRRTPEARPFAAYETQMTEAFDLDEERVRNLRYILQHYQEEVEALKERNLAALDPELVKIGLEHRALVRERVVPEHYLQQFDLWTAGLPAGPQAAN